MLMVLALLASVDSVPPLTVSLIRSGETDRPPVSATPRSLSDVASELRKGRKAVGGFSAVESTLPQSRSVSMPVFEPEPEMPMPEPGVVAQESPVYIPYYGSAWGGGHFRNPRFHRHFAGFRPGAPRVTPFSLRPSQRPMFRGHGMAGPFRGR